MKTIYYISRALFLSAIAISGTNLSGQELQGPNSGSSFKLPAIGSQGKSGLRTAGDDFHREHLCMRALTETKRFPEGTKEYPFDLGRASHGFLTYESVSPSSFDIIFPHLRGSSVEIFSFNDGKILSAEISSSPIVLANKKSRFHSVNVEVNGKKTPLDIAYSISNPLLPEIYEGHSVLEGIIRKPRTSVTLVPPSHSSDELRKIIHQKIRVMLSTTPERLKLSIEDLNNPKGQTQGERAQYSTNSKNSYDFTVSQVKKAICYCGSITALEPEIQKLKEDQRVQGIVKDLSCDLS